MSGTTTPITVFCPACQCTKTHPVGGYPLHERTCPVTAAELTATYEAVITRMEAARRGLQHARREAERIVREAEEEWAAADAELTRLEASPGVASRHHVM